MAKWWCWWSSYDVDARVVAGVIREGGEVVLAGGDSGKVGVIVVFAVVVKVVLAVRAGGGRHYGALSGDVKEYAWPEN